MNLIPIPQGLSNIGNTCYLNSIVQALLSCRNFNAIMILWETKNSSTEQYNKILKGEINHVGALFQTISGHGLQYGHQEDAHEGLLMLLDSFGDEISKVFNIKHRTIFKCICGFRNTSKGCPEVFVDYYSDSQSTLQSYLLRQTIKPNDYRCDLCKQLNSTRMIKQLYSISDVIIVTFKQYHYKTNINFPTEIILAPTLRYQLVAQIEHFGGPHGGHYVTRALRQGTVYLFNDSSVTVSSFQPTLHTYMIWYHKL
jgi:ubiquitin C-terminal hydrolase